MKILTVVHEVDRNPRQESQSHDDAAVDINEVIGNECDDPVPCKVVPAGEQQADRLKENRLESRIGHVHRGSRPGAQIGVVNEIADGHAIHGDVDDIPFGLQPGKDRFRYFRRAGFVELETGEPQAGPRTE